MNGRGKRFYQVYQCHAPSGGVGPVDETRYDTLEEARGVAEGLMSEVSEFTIHNIDGTDYAYPAYWPQRVREDFPGMFFIDMSTDEDEKDVSSQTSTSTPYRRRSRNVILSWIRRKRREKKERQIRDRYLTFARSLGDALSYLHVGDAAFRWGGELWSVREYGTYHKLRELEADYSSLGYRIVPLDVWIDHGGWGVSIDQHWRVPREEGERPQFTTFDVEDLPAPSPMLKIMEETGKPVVAEVDEDGETVYRVVDDA